MRIKTFALRNAREILRDPVNLGFGLGFPLVLLLLMSAIQASIPVSLFEIHHLTPGITVFGLSFMALFSGTIVAKDRGSALLQRLYTTPMRPLDFILGYTLPMIPMAIAQTLICYGAAAAFGMEISIKLLYAVALNVPVALLFIGIGLLCGSVLGDKQVGGICGAMLTNVSAWLSGIWFDLELVGGTFQKIAHLLPFVHAVEMERAVIAGNFGQIMPHLWWVLAYDGVILTAAVLLFLRQMKRQ